MRRSALRLCTKPPPWGSEPSPHKVLGVPSGASEKEVRQAFLRLAKEHHPDSNAAQKSASMFLAVREAYMVLKERTSSRKRRSGGGGSGGGTLSDALKVWTARNPGPPRPRWELRKKKASGAKKRGGGGGVRAGGVRNGGDCALCGKRLLVPVHLKTRLECCAEGRRGVTACLTCARDALGLNGIMKQRRVRSLRECPHCEEPAAHPPPQPLESSYAVDEELAERLDAAYGDVTCPTCKEWTGPRMEYAQHMKTCRHCSRCGELVASNGGVAKFHQCVKPQTPRR